MRALVLLWVGCGGSELSANVTRATLAERDLTLAVHYRDSDGNLGGGQAEIQDCRRADLLTKLDLPNIASEEAVKAGVAIEGELDLHVYQIGEVAQPMNACNGVSGELVFCVTLIDTAGRRSNTSCTKSLK